MRLVAFWHLSAVVASVHSEPLLVCDCHEIGRKYYPMMLSEFDCTPPTLSHPTFFLVSPPDHQPRYEENANIM